MQIKVYPGTELEALENETLMQTLVRHQIYTNNVCNGKGTCGKCKVHFLSDAPLPTEVEKKHLSTGEIDEGIRLACATIIKNTMEIEIPQHQAYDRKEAALRKFSATELNPGVFKLFIQTQKPSVADEKGDWERVLDGLNTRTETEQDDLYRVYKPAYSVLQKLSEVLRSENHSITVTIWQDTVINVEPGDTTQSLFGLAVDIGTTSVAVALVNLNDGNILTVASVENAQTAYGADVISRITYARENSSQAKELQRAVRETINSLIQEVVQQAGISHLDIYKMTLVGNTTMHHLFLGLNVSYLAVSPFISTGNSPMEFLAKELGIKIHPEGRILTLPNIAGFVGGDTVGAIVGSPEVLSEGSHLLIDLGTNCELFLKTPEIILACSTAAGPAFEGAGIAQGMRAKPGAIEGVQITGDTVEIKVIGEQPPVGICGSGLIQAIDEMKQAGVLNIQGRIQDPIEADLPMILKERVIQGEKGREFVLFHGNQDQDIKLTQKDIGELQLAKGAVCAGIRTLLDQAGISIDNLDSVVLAGTFATYLKIESVLEIGLVPEIDRERINAVGNAAHVGALKTLINQKEYEEASRLVRGVKHVELASSSVFSNYFMNSMYLERTK
jgi:uncharacterized 2Fe-2S/4Fe-4S cluster protein (DUF4445 family)